MKKTNHNNPRYNAVFRAEPEGGFTVTVPALPGCVTYGRNLNQAKKMAVDAVSAYLASLEKHGESIPSDDDSFISSIQPTNKSIATHA